MINESVKEIEITEIRKFANLISKHPNPINLTVGEPDFPTPKLVKEAAIQAINENKTTYTHNAGLLELRKSVSNFFKDTYEFYYDPKTEIVITNGASEAIYSVLKTLLNKNDEIIVPAPIYPAYLPIIQMSGAKIVYLDTTDTNFVPCPQRLKSIITKNTKAILFNYPSNPTGATISKELMDEIVSIIKNKNIFIISDEIYSENTFSHKHISFASYPDIRESLFLIHGVSKSHAMTGWRVGFILGPSKIMTHLLNLHLYITGCAGMPNQIAAITALNDCRNSASEMNVEYIKRRDFLYSKLKNMNFGVTKPNGAFYIFPSISNFNVNSYEFALKLLKETGLATVPGSGFSKYGEGYIRISYATSMNNLEEGINRLEKFMNEFY